MTTNGRDAICSVFNRHAPPRPIVCIRLDQWHQDAAHRKTLPPELAAKSVHEIARILGFPAAARFRGYLDFKFEAAHWTRSEADGSIVTTCRVGNHTMRSVERLTPDMVAAGMMPHVTEHLCRTDADYKALITAWQSCHVAANEAAFGDFDRRVGDDGLPMLILHGCPAHMVALSYTGYERFYLDLVDRPDVLDTLIQTIDRVYREQVWPLAAESSAKLLLHGSHFSAAMTPPPIFERYFMPYFTDFNAAMHAADKWVCFHGDADLGILTPRIPEIGFDGADCLATAPLVKETLADYVAIWRGKVVAWGGLPSVIFPPTFPERAYKEYVMHALHFARGRNDVILGSGDIVMPGTPWERLLLLSKAASLNG